MPANSWLGSVSQENYACECLIERVMVMLILLIIDVKEQVLYVFETKLLPVELVERE